MARHKVAVLSLAAIALVSSFWFLLDVLGAAVHSTQTFGVAAFEERFGDFPKTVSPHTVFGYLSDTSPRDPSALAEYHLTQYVLAPAIVRQSTRESQVIVNYHAKSLDPKFLQTNHLRMVRVFGNGLALCVPERL